jgi:uncharacterized protein YbjT (DUF2867 family)
MRIVVIGGAGRVGAKLVTTLRHRGHDVVAASRRSGVDTLTGEGLVEALAGAKLIIDAVNSPSYEGETAVDFFRTSTQNVIAAAEAARVKHHVVVSIVGTERMLGSGYFRAKLAQETLVGISKIPHTILRSTQFFDFLPHITDSDATSDVVRVAPVWAQPVAADEVAAALADLAMAGPRNDMIEHAGPELFRLDDIVRRVMQAAQDPRSVVTDPQARYFGAQLRDDTLTPDEGAIIGVTRLDDWLRSTPLAPFTQQRDIASTQELALNP